MEYLFSLKPNQTLSEGIKALSKPQISGLAYSSIVERGYNYFRDGEVYPNVQTSIGKYELEVSGSYSEYKIVIQQEKEKVNASCDCPFDDGICKHIIASLLHLQNNVQISVLQKADITAAVIAKEEKAKSDFEKYVDNLPIDELRKLVLQFAPENFREEVTIKQNLKKGNTKKVTQAFSKAATPIKKLFDGDLYDINEFVEKTDKALAKLRPFWQTHSDKIATELANFIKKVDNAFDEGELSGYYHEGYDDYCEDSYEAEEVSAYIGEFIGAIPNDKRKTALLKLLKAKENLGYTICNSMESAIITAIPKEDLPQFANLVLEIDLFKYFNRTDDDIALYEKIEPYLNDDQKEKILLENETNSWFNFALAKHYETKADYQKAYDTLAEYFRNAETNSYTYGNEFKHSQYQMIIRLCDENLGGKNTLYWIEKYLQKTPSVGSFQTAIKHRPEKRATFETYLEQNHVTKFVTILEQEKRLQEVIELFKTYPNKFEDSDDIYEFFQRHKLLFPNEATPVFKKELDVHLQEAKQYHYERVGEIISELQPILSDSDFYSLVSGIKLKYKRRTNLMGILGRKGF